jgi:2-dehydropantoate 2-reductase
MKQGSEFKPTRFAVVGAGPVGCIVAAFLAKGGYDVTLCDVVPALIAPALDPGIILEGAENFTQKVTRTCRMIDELAEFDPEVIFITVKANALPLIASALETFYREGMAVISWQNGIDTELELTKTLGRGGVMRAVVNYGCGLVAPGRVRLPFHHPPHYLQELDPAVKQATVAIAQALTRCGLPTEDTREIISMVWRKGVLNACMNPVCAVTGLTMNRAMNDPIVFQIVNALVKECIQVARANENQPGLGLLPARDRVHGQGRRPQTLHAHGHRGLPAHGDRLHQREVRRIRPAGRDGHPVQQDPPVAGEGLGIEHRIEKETVRAAW